MLLVTPPPLESGGGGAAVESHVPQVLGQAVIWP